MLRLHFSEIHIHLLWYLKILPEPKNDDFYEWWIVQKDPFQFISTGKIEDKAGMKVNTFTSSTDYRSYDFYVLTLEPNDGDPTPADHIIEWILEF